MSFAFAWNDWSYLGTCPLFRSSWAVFVVFFDFIRVGVILPIRHQRIACFGREFSPRISSLRMRRAFGISSLIYRVDLHPKLKIDTKNDALENVPPFKNGYCLGHRALIINPIYTLYSGYLLGPYLLFKGWIWGDFWVSIDKISGLTTRKFNSPGWAPLSPGLAPLTQGLWTFF